MREARNRLRTNSLMLTKDKHAPDPKRTYDQTISGLGGKALRSLLLQPRIEAFKQNERSWSQWQPLNFYTYSWLISFILVGVSYQLLFSLSSFSWDDWSKSIYK